jgi:hypothetical protein
MPEGSVEVSHFARVFVSDPGELPPKADCYKSERGHYYTLNLNELGENAASALISKASDYAETVEVVGQVRENGEITKERRYVDSVHDVPDGYKPERGPEGGIYYETQGQAAPSEGSGAPQGVGETVGYSGQPVLAIQFEDIDEGDRIAFETSEGERDMGRVVSIEEDDNLVTVQSGDGTTEVAAAPLEGVEEKEDAGVTSGTPGVHSARYSPSDEDESEDEEDDLGFGGEIGKDCDGHHVGPGEYEGHDLDGNEVLCEPADEVYDINADIESAEPLGECPGCGDDLSSIVKALQKAGEEHIYGPYTNGTSIRLEQGEAYCENEGEAFRTDEGDEQVTTCPVCGDGLGDHGEVPGPDGETGHLGKDDDQGVWTYYYGPKGGEGWMNLQTGEIRYQKERPGQAPEDGDGYGDWISEGWGEPPDDLSELTPGQAIEVYDEHNDEYREGEVESVDGEDVTVGGEELPGDHEIGDLGTHLTAVEEDYTPIEDAMEDWANEDGVYDSVEEYWEDIHAEPPDSAPEEARSLEYGDEEYDIELPNGTEVEVPLAGYAEEDGEFFSTSGPVVATEELADEVGFEQLQDKLNVPAEKLGPAIQMPDESIEDMVQGFEEVEDAGPPDGWGGVDLYPEEAFFEGVEEGDPIAYQPPHEDEWRISEVKMTEEDSVLTEEDKFVWPDAMDVRVPEEVQDDVADAHLSDEEESEGSEEVTEEAVGEEVADEPDSGESGALEPADPEEFTQAVEEFAENNPDLAPMLTMHDPEEMEDYDVFLSEEGNAGVAVSPDGDIQNVISAEGASVDGDQVMEAAIEAGGKTLDCYDGFLTDFYESHGFDVTGTMDFNPEFAPEGWDENPHLENQPDVMFMAHEAEGEDEVKHYDGTEWDEAKADSQRAAGLGEDGGAEGGGVGSGEQGPDDGAGEDGGDDEGVTVTPAEPSASGLWDDSDTLETRTPDDVASFSPLEEDHNVSHGNTMAAKQTAEFEDGTKAVYTDTSHPDADKDLGERATTSANFARALFEDYDEHGVPQIEGEPQDGYFFSASAPGYDVAKAPDEYKDAVDEDDFLRQAGIQVLLGNNDAHSNNVKVDEDGNLHWFDMDHAGGSIHNPSAINKSFEYDDGWDRILGELASTGSQLGFGSKHELRSAISEAAQEVASDLGDGQVDEAHDAASEHNTKFVDNIVSNIQDLRNGNIPYEP